MITATGIANDFIVVTRNISDIELSGASMIDTWCCQGTDNVFAAYHRRQVGTTHLAACIAQAGRQISNSRREAIKS